MTMTPTKAAVQQYWDSAPCGSSETAAQVPSADFFQAHSDLRYSREPERRGECRIMFYHRRSLLDASRSSVENSGMKRR
jgi:hypothetical protein